MPRQPESRIRVTFPSGESICYGQAIYTVLDVLRRIDPSQYDRIQLESGGRRLITNNVDERDEIHKKSIRDGWWYINRLTNTDNKVLQLHEINRLFNLGIKIESGPTLRITNRPDNPIKRRRQARRIRVTLNNGKVFDDDQFINVFRDFIYEINPVIVARKCQAVVFRGEPLVRTTNLYNNRANLGDNLWFLEPLSSRQAFSIIVIISRRCGIECNVEIY